MKYVTRLNSLSLKGETTSAITKDTVDMAMTAFPKTSITLKREQENCSVSLKIPLCYFINYVIGLMLPWTVG